MADWRDVLLVDGYNMIGGWPELSALSETGMQGARDRLLDMLADYQAFTGRRVIAVFDAYRVPGLGRSFVQGRYRSFSLRKKKPRTNALSGWLENSLTAAGRFMWQPAILWSSM